MNATRSKVLSLYKQLLKTRNTVFENDTKQLSATLTRLRKDFRANINLTDDKKIKEALKLGKDVNRLIRTEVYQVKKIDDKTFRLQVKPYMLNGPLDAKKPKKDGKH